MFRSCLISKFKELLIWKQILKIYLDIFSGGRGGGSSDMISNQRKNSDVDVELRKGGWRWSLASWISKLGNPQFDFLFILLLLLLFPSLVKSISLWLPNN